MNLTPFSAPQVDASGANPGVWRQYLDIANGLNDFHQTFTPRCSGGVQYGGWFSTRSDKAGTGGITIRNGSGVQGAIVATHQITVPIVNSSKTDPWTQFSYSAQLTAGQPYSFIVAMNDDMNFDEGFVVFTSGPCETVLQELPVRPTPVLPDPPTTSACCPPWNETWLANSLAYMGTGSISAPYTLRFQPNAALNSQLMAYVNYLNAVNPSVSGLEIQFQVFNAGTAAAAVPVGSPIASHSAVWTAGASPTVNFFNPGLMQVDKWYRVRTRMSLKQGRLPTLTFGNDCVEHFIDVRIQVTLGRVAPGAAQPQPQLQIRLPDGRTLHQPLTGTAVPGRPQL